MKKSQSGFTLIEILILLLVLGVVGAIVGSLIIAFTGLHYETGRGEHTGFVTAVEKSGVIWKTGRAYIKTDVSSSQEDQYCVVDPAVYSQLEEVSKSRAKVTLKYKSWLAAGVSNCDGESAVIYSIQ